MNSPLVEVLDLTYAMLAAAAAGDWTEFRYLHECRTRLLEPRLYLGSDAPRLLPQLFAAQTELAGLRHAGEPALVEAAKFLRPIGDAMVEIPPVPREPMRAADALP